MNMAFPDKLSPKETFEIAIDRASLRRFYRLQALYGCLSTSMVISVLFTSASLEKLVHEYQDESLRWKEIEWWHGWRILPPGKGKP